MKTRRHTTNSHSSLSHIEDVTILSSTSTGQEQPATVSSAQQQSSTTVSSVQQQPTTDASSQQLTATSATSDIIEIAPKSTVWQYFERCTETVPLKAKCLLCQTELSTPNYGTSSLKRHLEQRHSIKQFGSTNTPIITIIHTKLSKTEKKNLDLLTVQAIIQDARSYDDLRKPDRKRNSYLVITGHYVTKKFDQYSKILKFMSFKDRHFSPLIANEIEKQLISLKLYDKLISITCDGAANMRDMFTYFNRRNINLNLWVTSKKKRNTTDAEGDTGTGMTEDDEDETQSGLSQMVRTMSFDTAPLSDDMTSYDSDSEDTSKENHDEDDNVNDGFESSGELTDVATDEEWVDEEDGIEETTDNFVEGVNTNETSLDHIPQMVKDVIDKTREIVRRIKSSSILTGFLEKKRLIYNAHVKMHKKIKQRLIIDVRSRWNSTYRMLHTFHIYRDFINDLFKSKASLDITPKQRRNLTRIELSSNDWDILKLSINLLHPFYNAIKVLSNKTYPTIGSALYLMKGLEDNLKEEEDNEILFALKQMVLGKFERYITNDVEQFDNLKLFSYFDPTGFSALTQTEQNKIEKEITKLYKNFFVPSQPSSSTSTNCQTTKPTNIDKAWQAFLKSTKKDKIQESQTTFTTIQEDIKRYRSLATKLYV